MNIIYSRPALTDLESIFEYLAPKNPLAAERLHRRIGAVTERLAVHPLSGQQLAQRPEVRRIALVNYPYVIFYTAHADEVVVLRILHGARLNPWENPRETE